MLRMVLCTVAVLTMAAAAQARECRDTVRAAGSANLVPAIARHSAIKAWKHEVTALYGRRFSDWANARNAHVIRDDNDGAMARYVVKAQPCHERQRD